VISRQHWPEMRHFAYIYQLSWHPGNARPRKVLPRSAPTSRHMWKRKPILLGIAVAAPVFLLFAFIWPLTTTTEDVTTPVPINYEGRQLWNHIPWGRHMAPTGNMQIISVSEDHRNLSLPSNLESLRLLLPSGKSTASTRRVFQLHLAVARDFFAQPGRKELLFSNVWVTLPAGDQLAAERCEADIPHGWGRYEASDAKSLELVIRCLFLLPHHWSVDWLLVNNALLLVEAAQDFASFPLSSVLHLGFPTPFLSSHTPSSYPFVPWANHSISGWAPTQPPSTRVGSWTPARFSWNYDDELWVMWMLDVVRVDHVVITIAVDKLSIEYVRTRLEVYPGIPDRVTLVAIDVPGEPTENSYFYLLELIVWDAFVRWQADFDYLFLVDADEFLQLFSPDPPHNRVDIKAFIVNNRADINRAGGAYFTRRHIWRQHNNRSEPLLPLFLTTLRQCNGETFQALDYKNEGLGKTVFPMHVAIRPYLHYNQGFSNKPWDTTVAHVLHVRHKKPSKVLSLARFVLLLRKPRFPP
jgi:hypothetical protein